LSYGRASFIILADL